MKREITFSQEQVRKLRLWEADLRSTDMKQGHFVLSRFYNDGTSDYCCLGRMLEVVYSVQWEVDKEDENFQEVRRKSGLVLKALNRRAFLNGEPEDIIPHDVVIEELGLSGNMNSIGLCVIHAFVLMNDRLYYSFVQIADEINHLIEHGCFTIETTRKLLHRLFAENHTDSAV